MIINVIRHNNPWLVVLPTCLWRPSLSISLRTQPTLPSPPQTRTRNDSKFWNSRNLTTTASSSH